MFASILLRCAALKVVSRGNISTRLLTNASEKQLANKKTRLQLAVAYRALDYYGLNEGVCNHLTAIAPALDGHGNVMLLVPYGLHWSNVTPLSLIGVNENNEVVEGEGEPEITALCIHKGIYAERPDIQCVMHTHMPYATTLGCLANPVLSMMHQNSARFYNRIAYDQVFDGIGDNFQEGRRLGKALGDKDVLVMGNHGVLTVSHSVSIAFDCMYYFERAAMIQVLAYSTQKEQKLLPQHIVNKTSDQMWKSMKITADAHLNAFLKRIEISEPNFHAL